MRGLESSNQTNIEDLKLVAQVLERDVASFSMFSIQANRADMADSGVMRRELQEK